jgi:hypothetical protein
MPFLLSGADKKRGGLINSAPHSAGTAFCFCLRRTINIPIYFFLNIIIALNKKQDKIFNKIKKKHDIFDGNMVFVDITYVKEIYFFKES